MESYNGILCTKRDALFLIEAAKQRLVPLVTQRFSSYERQTSIRAGAVFVWREQGSNIRRWTDGRKWSASRVSGVFLSYREMQPPRSQTSCHVVDEKHGGLIKQSFSYCAGSGDKFHVVGYAESDLAADPARLARCQRPSLDPRFRALAAAVDAAAADPAEPPRRTTAAANAAATGRKRALSVDSASPAKRLSTSPPPSPPSPASPLSPMRSQPPCPVLPPLQSLLGPAALGPCDFDRKTLLALRCSFS